MPTLSITKTFQAGSGSSKATASVVVKAPYTVTTSNTNVKIEFKTGNITVTFPTTGSGSNLTTAKNDRNTALSSWNSGQGIEYSLNCNGTSGNVKMWSMYISNAITIVNQTVSYTYQRGTTSSTKHVWALMTGVTHVAQDISVPAKTAYTITYNGNGATSGSVASQTKYYGESVSISSNNFEKTNYTFKRWNTKRDDSGITPPATYTANESITLYAIWNPIIKYNANDGTGAPSQQTKTYGTALLLSSTIPTRTNFKFLGWATSLIATQAQYQPGDSYTSEIATTLYAVWQKVYNSPQLIANAYRSDSQGNPSDDETVARYLTINTNWSIFDTTTAGGTANSATITAACNGVTATKTPSGLSGSEQFILNANLNPNTNYTATITITDRGSNAFGSQEVTLSSSSTSVTLDISMLFFPLDILAGGHGIAFGRPATTSDYMDCAFKALFRDDVYFAVSNSLQFKASDLVIKPGDVISYTSSYAYFPGIITNTSKTISLDIPLNKYIIANSVAVTGTVIMRSINGYVYNKSSSNGGVTNINIATYLDSINFNKEIGHIAINLINSTTWVNSSGTAIANNTPLVAASATLTLTFS